MQPSAAALTLGASLRLTRLVVADDLGEWWVKAPIYRAVLSRVPPHKHAHAAAYLDGLSCKWCVGYWIAVGVLASEALTRDTRLRPAWRFVTGTLTLNWLAAVISTVEDVAVIAADEAAE